MKAGVRDEVTDGRKDGVRDEVKEGMKDGVKIGWKMKVKIGFRNRSEHRRLFKAKVIIYYSAIPTRYWHEITTRSLNYAAEIFRSGHDMTHKIGSPLNAGEFVVVCHKALIKWITGKSISCLILFFLCGQNSLENIFGSYRNIRFHRIYLVSLKKKLF